MTGNVCHLTESITPTLFCHVLALNNTLLVTGPVALFTNIVHYTSETTLLASSQSLGGAWVSSGAISHLLSK